VAWPSPFLFLFALHRADVQYPLATALFPGCTSRPEGEAPLSARRRLLSFFSAEENIDVGCGGRSHFPFGGFVFSLSLMCPFSPLFFLLCHQHSRLRKFSRFHTFSLSSQGSPGFSHNPGYFFFPVQLTIWPIQLLISFFFPPPWRGGTPSFFFHDGRGNFVPDFSFESGFFPIAGTPGSSRKAHLSLFFLISWRRDGLPPSARVPPPFSSKKLLLLGLPVSWSRYYLPF